MTVLYLENMSIHDIFKAWIHPVLFYRPGRSCPAGPGRYCRNNLETCNDWIWRAMEQFLADVGSHNAAICLHHGIVGRRTHGSRNANIR
jgi:hypothetical protein